jgi:hypothetical protein
MTSIVQFAPRGAKIEVYTKLGAYIVDIIWRDGKRDNLWRGHQREVERVVLERIADGIELIIKASIMADPDDLAWEHFLPFLERMNFPRGEKWV